MYAETYNRYAMLIGKMCFCAQTLHVSEELSEAWIDDTLYTLYR